MAEDCVHTRFNGILDDDTLLKLGEVRLTVEFSQWQFNQTGSTSVSVKIVNGRIKNSINEQVYQSGDTFVIDSDNRYETLETSTVIFNPANVGTFRAKSDLADNIVWLNYFTNISNGVYLSPLTKRPYPGSIGDVVKNFQANSGSLLRLELVDYDLSGNNFNELIPYRDKMPYTVEINISSTGLNVDIKDIGYLQTLPSINLFGTNAYGSIESLVQNFRTNYPSRDTFTLQFGGTVDAEVINITFNGNRVVKSTWGSYPITWTASTITFDGVTINA